MSYTLTEAAARVQEHLDDDNTRWSDASTKLALRSAMNQTFAEYVQSGRHFDRILDTTSSAAGVVDLSSVVPYFVRGVMVNTGNLYTRLPAHEPMDAQILDDTARTVRVVYVPTPKWGTTGSDYVFEDQAGNSLKSREDMDELVCVRAAMMLSVKDGPIPSAFKELEARLVESVMSAPESPRARRPPARGSDYGALLGWFVNNEDQSIRLFRKVLR